MLGGWGGKRLPSAEEPQQTFKQLAMENGIEYNKKLFVDKFVNRSICEVLYNYEGGRYQFRFRDIEGEVQGFEY